jgi:hypothetical protein
MGSSNEGEREGAWAAIEKLLRKHRKTWNDMLELLAQTAPAAQRADEAPPPPSGPAVNSLDLVRYCLEDYVALQPHEYVAVTLWVHHAHVFERFMITPRLLLMSPVRGCGKTTLLDLIGQLVPRPSRSDNATPAALYRWIDATRSILLLDEVDNLGLTLRTNGVLRSVLNSGHRRGGGIDRVIKDVVKRYATFAPVALAAIGMVPLPLAHRSIAIHMARASRVMPRRLDDGDASLLEQAYRYAWHWADGDPVIDPNPEMPPALRNRAADNWRPLIAIADAFGPAWGELAREAAVTFTRGLRDEDLAVLLPGVRR